ncbi:MAG: HEAT repeat domain-containing protein, partial [Gemmataceae bacterium]|nr:HEAT repeat domain-containing protein [Gemmataceae bacterium]
MTRTLAALLLLVPAASASTFLDRSLGEWLADLESGKTPKVRRAAAFALSRMGLLGRDAVAGLAKRARDDDDASVRDMAAQALGEIVLASPGHVGVLWDRAGSILEKRCREEKDPRAKRSLVYALGSFGPEAKGAAEALRDALGDKAAPVRQNAAWALGRLGAKLDAASVRAIAERLRDDSALVRRDAAQALGHAG